MNLEQLKTENDTLKLIIGYLEISFLNDHKDAGKFVLEEIAKGDKARFERTDDKTLNEVKRILPLVLRGF